VLQEEDGKPSASKFVGRLFGGQAEVKDKTSEPKPKAKKSLDELYHEVSEKREKEKKEREEAVRKDKTEKRQRKKDRIGERMRMQQRTKKGQPVLGNQVVHMLKKLEAEQKGSG